MNLNKLEQAHMSVMSLNGRKSAQISLNKPKRVWVSLNELK